MNEYHELSADKPLTLGKPGKLSPLAMPVPIAKSYWPATPLQNNMANPKTSFMQIEPEREPETMHYVVFRTIINKQVFALVIFYTWSLL